MDEYPHEEEAPVVPPRGLDKLAAALAKAQGEIKAAAKNAVNPGLHNKYADLASVWEACRAPLSKNGLAVSQWPELRGDNIVLHTYLLHESGQCLEGFYPIQVGGENRAVNAHQALGVAISYAKRYVLSGILGVVADDDDDGQGAAGVQPVASRQAPKPTATPKPAGSGSKPVEPPVTCKACDAIVEETLVPGLRKRKWPDLCRSCIRDARDGNMADFPAAAREQVETEKANAAAQAEVAAQAEEVTATEGGAE